MRLGPRTWRVPPLPLPFENLALGRLFASLGDPVRGLAAVRRGGYGGGHDVFFFSSYLREEGRLAALAGDRAGAIRAYQRYLALRPHPDREVKPELDAVRAELARLLQER